MKPKNKVLTFNGLPKRLVEDSELLTIVAVKTCFATSLKLWSLDRFPVRPNFGSATAWPLRSQTALQPPQYGGCCWTMPVPPSLPSFSALLLLPHGWGNSICAGFCGVRISSHPEREGEDKKHLWTIVNKCSFNPPRQMQRTRSVSLDTFTPSFHTKHHANLGPFPVLVSFWHVPGGSILQTDADAVFTKGTVLSLSGIIRRIRRCMLFFNL